MAARPSVSCLKEDRAWTKQPQRAFLSRMLTPASRISQRIPPEWYKASAWGPSKEATRAPGRPSSTGRWTQVRPPFSSPGSHIVAVLYGGRYSIFISHKPSGKQSIWVVSGRGLSIRDQETPSAMLPCILKVQPSKPHPRRAPGGWGGGGAWGFHMLLDDTSASLNC